MKMLGKLGLDLTKLKDDMNTLDNLINKGNKESKKLGEAWKNVANEMTKAFKGFPLTEYIKALEKFEKAQKSGLGKVAKESQRFNESEKRKSEKHQNTMLAQQMLYNAKIEAMKERNALRMAQDAEKFQTREARSLQQHLGGMNRMYAESENPFVKRFNSLSDYIVASGAIYGTTSAIKEVIKVNKEFEVGQVNLQRILKATNEEMEGIKRVTLEVGKATGNLPPAIQEIENLWIRTGKVTTETLGEITKVSSIGLNVAQFKDAEEAVAMLNGAINQMADGDIQHAQAILDSWAKTADVTAVKSARDLAEVISRAGSQGRQLGMTFHDLNAITGVLSDRMAIGGEKIGTALKSVFSRIQNPDNIKVVEKWGVSITEIGEGGKETFRPFVDIMNDLNGKFKELKEQDYGTAMAEIQKAMGGTHQRAVIANLIEGWDSYKYFVTESLNSSGFAMQQNEAIMQTFDKQVEVLKVSLTELALELGENGLMDALQGLVSGTTEAVQWFSNLNPHVRNTIMTATELMTVFGLLNLTFKKFAKVGLIEVLFNIVKMRTGVIQLAQAEDMLNAKVVAGTISEAQRTAILKVLRGEELATTLQGTARTAMLEAQTVVTWGATTATTALMTAITAGLVLIPIIIGLVSSWKRSKEELNRETLEHIKNMKDELAEEDKLIKEYEALAQKTSLTADEKARLNQIEERFAEIYPKTINGINEQSDAYKDQIGIIRQLNLEKKKALLEESQLFVDANKSEYEKAQKKVAEYQDKINNATKNLTRTYTGGGRSVTSTPTKEEEAEYILIQKQKMAEYVTLVEEYEKNRKTIQEVQKAIKESTGEIWIDKNGREYNLNDPYEEVKAMKAYNRENAKSSTSSKTTTTSYEDFDPNEHAYALDKLEHDFSMERMTEAQYANKLSELLNNNKDMLDESEIWSLEEKIHQLLKPKQTSKSGTGIKVLDDAMKNLEHRSKMEEITDADYAKELEKLLGTYKGRLDKDDMWNIEEKIHQLKKPKNKTAIPASMQELMDGMEHLVKMDKLTETEYAGKLEKLLGEYRNQLDEKTIWSLEEKIYTMRKNSKPNIGAVNYEDFQKNIQAIEREIKGLERQGQLYETLGKKKSAIVPVMTKQVAEYEKKQKELNKVNGEYVKLLANLEKQIADLDPTSIHYTDTVESLTEEKKKLTEEILNNTDALVDNEIQIAKINAQMQEYIEDSLKQVYELQQKIAEEELEKRQEAEILSLKKQIFNITEEQLRAYGLETSLVSDQEEAYTKIMDARKKAKQDEIDALDEQIEKQEYLNKISEIQSEIEKVRADTRFAYIDEATGKEVYTYDRAKLAELEKDLAKEVADHEIEEKKKQLKNDIDVIEQEEKRVKEHYDKLAKTQEEAHRNEKKSFDMYWSIRLSDVSIRQDAENMIKQLGYNKAMEIAQGYFDNVKKLYDDRSIESYEGGKKITDELAKGLFENIDKVILDYQNKLATLNTLKSSVESASAMTSFSAVKAMAEIVGSSIKATPPTSGSSVSSLVPKSQPQLNSLSVALPQMTYGSTTPKVSSPSQTTLPKQIVINIDKLTPSDFDGFMKSIDPYINSHK